MNFMISSSLKLFRKSWHPRSRGEMKQLSPSQELVSYLRFARMQVTLEWLLIKYLKILRKSFSSLWKFSFADYHADMYNGILMYAFLISTD